MESFILDVSPSVLDDLRDRLVRTRWPDQVDGAAWDYGTELSYLKELVHSWLTQFDWRKQAQAPVPYLRATLLASVR